MRITIESEKALNIACAINNVCDTKDFKKVFEYKEDERDKFIESLKDLANEIIKEYHKPIKTTKRNATKKATNTKIEIAKEKINNTINFMRLEGKKINVNSVARNSGVAYNTVKKYKYLFIDY